MLRRLFVLFLCLFSTLPVFGAWKSLKTDAFTVFYPSGREQEAREILGVLEGYRSYVGELIGSAPQRVAVVLEDIGNESNGFTDVTFRRIFLFRSSPSANELSYHQNWWRLVGVHEYTHWGHLSGARGLPRALTVLFGNTMAPGNYTPGWLKEGVCVVAESGMSPYEGRLNEGLFDAYATVLAQKGSLPSIVQATYNIDDFPGGTGPYLFGGQFLEFLVAEFGRQRVSRFFMHYSASILSYLSPALPAAGLDRSARKVFGESIRSLWIRWQLNLMRSSVSFKRPEGALTDHGWRLSSPVVGDGTLYYQRSFPVKASPFSTAWHHQLLALDLDSRRSRVLLRSSASFTGPMRLRSGNLFYALQELEGGHENHTYNRRGVTSVLYSRDLESRRRSRRLFVEPFRSFEVLADGSILTAVDREDAFGSEIRLRDPAAGTSATVLVTDLLIADLTADGKNLFVAARSDWDNVQIYRVTVPGWSGTGKSLSQADPERIRLERLHDTPFQEAELCLAGNRLFYSATYEAKRTLYEYQISTGTVYRSVNSDFARSPAWDGEGRSLYYIGLNEGGEDLYREDVLAREITVPADDSAGGSSSAEWEIPESEISSGGYLDNLATLLPKTLFPVFSLGPDGSTFEAGAGMAGVSALGDVQYLLLGTYDSRENLPALEAGVQTNVLAPLTATFDLSAAGDPLNPGQLELGLTLELPLVQRLGKGFSYLSVATAGILEWEAAGDNTRVLFPYTVMGLQGAVSRFVAQIGVQAVHDVVSNEFAYLLVPAVSASVAFLGTELSVRASFLYDLLGRYTWSFPGAPPGYPDVLDGSWGGYVFSTFSVPLLRLRGGLWNPGLYFGDLFFIPFLSLAFDQDLQLQMSYGAALHLEIKAGARDEGFPVDLYAGLGMTREGQPLVLLGIQLIGYGGGYGRDPSSGSSPRPALRR